MSLSYPEVLALVGPRSFHAFLEQYQRTLLWSETLEDILASFPLDSTDIEITISDETYLTLIDDSLGFLRDLFQSTDPAIVQFRRYRNLEQEDGSDNQDNRNIWQSMAHGLVLSRNGHGAGFWDGDWEVWNIPGLGDALHALAKAQGERHLCGHRLDDEQDSYLVYVF